MGNCAEGDLLTMLRQIDSAKAAGCDCVKAQWLSNPARLVERRKAQDYAGNYAMLAYPLAWLGVMREHAHDLGFEWRCSVYLPEDVEAVAPFVDGLKVSSFEYRANDVFEAASGTELPVMVSLGMAEHQEMMAIVAWRDSRRRYAPTNLLHCVSAYSVAIPPAQWNLGAIRRYGLDGFSDHTRSVQSGHDAVLAGARILEVHMRTADANPDNPDYGVALAPDRLKQYVELVREASQKLGDGVKRAQPCEAEMLKYRTVTP
jgi:sialic acid synthase SpsE